MKDSIGDFEAEPIAASRLALAKRSFVTRRVSLPKTARIATFGATPRSGDIILAQVEEIGHHTKLELVNGRRAVLYPGDDVILCYADRYAPDQFLATVPSDLGGCDLVAAGGIAGRVVTRAQRARRPTRIQPVGILCDESGVRLSTRDFAMDFRKRAPGFVSRPPTVVAVIGSSMNAGKTTTMAALIHSEVRSGRRVGAAKVTGTGAGCDLWSYLDAGAHAALDFTDAGLPSTFRAGRKQIETVFERLLDEICATEVDTIFLEVADGILFEETANLIFSKRFQERVHGVVFAASDALGAVAGASKLMRQDLNLLAISGRFTQSPLALEEVRRATTTPAVTIGEVLSGAWSLSDVVAQPCGKVA